MRQKKRERKRERQSEGGQRVRDKERQKGWKFFP